MNRTEQNSWLILTGICSFNLTGNQQSLHVACQEVQTTSFSKFCRSHVGSHLIFSLRNVTHYSIYYKRLYIIICFYSFAVIIPFEEN